MHHAHAIARHDQASNSESDALYVFLRTHHRNDAFEGRNGRDRWLDYSATVTRHYRQTLDRRGFARIPAYESSSGAPVFFDRSLKLIEGERLQYAERGKFAEFDQSAFLSGIITSPYGIQTTSLGECVMGIRVIASGTQLLVWSNDQSAEPERRVTSAIKRAVCNSRSVSTFIDFLKSKPEDISIETFE